MAGWRVLTLSDKRDDPDRPILLVKHDFQQNRYTVYLTDLARIWEESLDRKSIIKRALNDGTSIDPSEGADQLKVLLLHLSSAVSGDTGSVKLQSASDHDILNMRVVVGLPEPLEPLEWTFALRQTRNETLFQQLQVPLFERCFTRHVEVDSLLSCVTERDKVISRLVDKLDASGIDLATIFPSAASSRGSRTAVREQLLRNVPGLQPFDKAEWKAKADGVKWESKDELLRRTLASEEGTAASDLWALPPNWWKSLHAEGNLLHFPSFHTEPDSTPSPAALDRSFASRMDEDDFQVQDVSKLSRNLASSPPRGPPPKVQVKDSQPAHVRPNSATGDSSTEDEVDLDAPPSPAVSRAGNSRTPERPAPQEPRRKLGRLGGNGKQPDRPPPPSTPGREAMDVDSPLATLEPDSVAPEKPRRKLGRIGGLISTKPEADKELPLRRSYDADDGMQDVDDERQSRDIRRGSETERETSTERADRLREELKRDLEEKRKAPAKKRRKF